MDTTVLRLVLGVIAACAAVYLIWPQVTLWLDRVREPGCAKCRYPVRGITSMTCSECGSDLRQVGIITPGMMMRRRASRATVLAVWTLAWALLAFGGAVAASTLLSGRIRAIKVQTFDSTGVPGATLEARLEWIGWRPPPRRGEWSLTFKDPAKPENSGTLLATEPGAIVTGGTGTAAGLDAQLADEAALGAWLTRCGEPQPQAAAADLLAAVRAVAQQGYNVGMSVSTGPAWTSQGTSVSVRQETPWWVQAGAGLAWLVVWGVVTLVVLRRYPRRGGRAGHAGARSPEPPVPLSTATP